MLAKPSSREKTATSDIAILANIIRPDDTLRFKLSAQKEIVQDNARIVVEVHTLISMAASERKILGQRIHAALNGFISADWVFSTNQRDGDFVGYERVALNASARIPLAEVYNLEERARQASEEGFSLRNPSLNYSLPTQFITDTAQELRRQIIEDAKRQMVEFRQTTGRAWRIGDIAFSWPKRRVEQRAEKELRRVSDDASAVLFSTADGASMANAELITLLADVTLRARS